MTPSYSSKKKSSENRKILSSKISEREKTVDDTNSRNFWNSLKSMNDFVHYEHSTPHPPQPPPSDFRRKMDKPIKLSVQLKLQTPWTSLY